MKLLDLITLVGVIVVFLTLWALLLRVEKLAAGRLGERSLGVKRLVRPVALALFAGALHGGLAIRANDNRLTLAALVLALVFVGVRILELLFFDLYLRRITGVGVPAVARSFAGSAFVVVCALGYAHLARNVPLTDILIFAAVVLGAFVLLFQGTFRSLKVGLRVSLQDDFKVGDVIRVAEAEGKVTSIDWRNTRLRTPAGSEVVVANALLFERPVEIWRRSNPHHQGRVEVAVPVEAAPNGVIQELVRGAQELEGVLEEPPPRACFLGSGPEMGRYLVEFWAAGQRQRLRLEEELSLALWYRLRRAGLVAPTGGTAEASVRDFIEQVPFLAVAERAQVDALAQRAELARFGRGEHLCHEGEEGDSLYVLREGELEVSVRTRRGRRVVSTIRPGGYVGERSLLTGEPRNADVTAITDCEVLVITKDDLLDLLRADPRLADQIGEEMERREQESTRQVSDDPAQVPRTLGDRIREFFGLGGP